MLATLAPTHIFILALLAIIFAFAFLMRVATIIGDRVRVEVDIAPDNDPAPSTGKTTLPPKVDEAPPAPAAGAPAGEGCPPGCPCKTEEPTEWQEELYQGVRDALSTALPFVASRALAARILTVRGANLWEIVLSYEIAMFYVEDVGGLDVTMAEGLGETSVLHVKDGKLAEYQTAMRMALEYADALATSVRWPEGTDDSYEALAPETLDAAVAPPTALVS